jgi:hypothetical protein
MNHINEVWVFNGVNNKFPSAIFTNRKDAEDWISKFLLSGILTLYPLNQSVYEWAITNNFFSPKSGKDSSPEFIQKFSSASQEHYHYDEGKID